MVTETDRLLNDMRGYLRAFAAVSARPGANQVIDSQDKAIVYSKLDGNTAQAKLAQTSGIPQQTISWWLSKFLEQNLVTPPNEYYGAYRALYTLQELNIDLATLRKRSKNLGANLEVSVSETRKKEEIV